MGVHQDDGSGLVVPGSRSRLQDVTGPLGLSGIIGGSLMAFADIDADNTVRDVRIARAVRPAGGVIACSLVPRVQVDFFLSVSPEGVVAHERAAANVRQAAERAAKERDLAQAAAQQQWDQTSFDDANVDAPPSRPSRTLGEQEQDLALPTGEKNSAGDDARDRTWPERQLQLWVWDSKARSFRTEPSMQWDVPGLLGLIPGDFNYDGVLDTIVMAAEPRCANTPHHTFARTRATADLLPAHPRPLPCDNPVANACCALCLLRCASVGAIRLYQCNHTFGCFDEVDVLQIAASQVPTHSPLSRRFLPALAALAPASSIRAPCDSQDAQTCLSPLPFLTRPLL